MGRSGGWGSSGLVALALAAAAAAGAQPGSAGVDPAGSGNGRDAPAAAAPPDELSITAPPPVIVRVPPAMRSEAGAPAEVSVSPDGRTIVISGAIGMGTAARVSRALTEASEARVVALYSPGGDLLEAQRIATLLRARALDTSVDLLCVSACTLILLAGEERSATPNATIGFHRPEPYRRTDEQRRNALALARSLYQRAGVADAFIERALATPFESIWTPDYETMRSANVLTRRSLGGETSALAARYASRDALGDALVADDASRTLRALHPELVEAAIDSAWRARESGANDLGIRNAFRAVLMARLPELLATATDDQVDEYLQLAIDQLQAARRLDPEACVRLARGQLDASFTIPFELIEREVELMVQIASNPPLAPAPPKREVADQLLEGILAALPEDQVAALAEPESAASSGAICEASLNFFSAIRSLPRVSRGTVQRYLFSLAGADPVTED